MRTALSVIAIVLCLAAVVGLRYWRSQRRAEARQRAEIQRSVEKTFQDPELRRRMDEAVRGPMEEARRRNQAIVDEMKRKNAERLEALRRGGGAATTPPAQP